MGEKQKEKKILSPKEFKKAIKRLAHQVLESSSNPADLVIIGIQTRGAHLAKRLQNTIKEISDHELPLGILGITLYRDDLTTIGPQPIVKETAIDFDVNDKEIILVDDVLFTGRTIRAALDEIMDFGRPKKIKLLVLIDRGYRELPIKADFVGKNIPTSDKEVVEVRTQEKDGDDEVVIILEKESLR